MSRTRNKNEVGHRIFGEDEASTSGDDGLEIVKSTRKNGLDLSQYIDAITSQSQSQPHSNDKSHEQATDDESSDSDDVQPLKGPAKQAKQNRNRHPRKEPPPEDDDSANEANESSDSDWPEENLDNAYEIFKGRRTLKRKRVAAETKRIRVQKKSRVAAATSIIGRKVQSNKKPTARDVLSPFSNDSAPERGDETYLDDPTPEYIEARIKKLKQLHEAGLRYPPCYDDVDFSDAEDDGEKPVLHGIKPQRPKKNIKLRQSGGIISAPIAQWLRDYQVEGVQFLHDRFVRQTGALLGDDMGLGKTIQVIAFLTAAFGKTASKRDFKRMRKMRRVSDSRWYPRILIVCPGTLMQNWEDELEKWGWWTVYKYHGNPADRKGVLGAARKGMAEIMMTTYDTYRNNESEINTVDWDCVIADECHQLKNKNAAVTKAMNRVNALCRIGLTGTAIQNKYEELWNLLNWARPGTYGSAQEWKQSTCIPLKVGQAHDASFAQLALARSKAKTLVETILPDVFLRRMKTLIADQLPKKTDRVVFCQLTQKQADAYRAYLESDRCEYIRHAKEECDCNSGKKRGWCCYQEIPGEGKWGEFMFSAMLTLQKIANHMGLILPRSSDSQEKQTKDMENLELACPDDWKDLYRIRDNILRISRDRELCGKWKVLKRLLDFWQANGDKVLIFSHSVRLLRLLKSLFDIDGTKYNFSYLDGSMTLPERARAVADFNSDKTQFVFLISTKAGGVGLNITSANKVVVIDPNWNPAYDLQAQDRAYRIGQTRDVEVFRLVSSGTIEEIIYARQIYKQQQANIGYTASDERRYFKGVMDEKGKVGELFGLQNLFSFEETGQLLRDIVHKTNVAETRAGVDTTDLHLEADDMDSEEEDELLSDKNLGLTDDDGTEFSQMKKFADDFVTSGHSDLFTSSKPRSRKKYAKRTGPDPINAILAKAGVTYTHENSEVIGKSKIEAELGRKAMEVRNDVELSRKRVFEFSQSQSQDHSGPRAHRFGFHEDEDVEYSGDDIEDEDGDVRMMGQGRAQRHEGFKINYRYRPDERVRRRQFCSMAQVMGYEDPVEFALVIEDMSSEQRRKVLEKFYRARRKQVVQEWSEG